MNYGIFVNEFQYSVVSSFIGSGVGFVISVWFVLAVVLNSKKNFIIAKLTVWVWQGVATYNERTNRLCLQTLVNKLLTW